MKNIRTEIDRIFEARKLEDSLIKNKPNHVESVAAYDPASDDYSEIKSEEIPVTAGIVKKVSPSSLGKKGSKNRSIRKALKNAERV